MQYDTKNQSTEQISVKVQKVHTMRNATLNIIMWLLAFVLVLTIMAVLPMPNDNRINVNTAVAQGVADDGTTATAFAGGTGTEEDPYQIATPMQLRLLSETTDYTTYWGSGTVDSSDMSVTITNAVYYELTANLELTSTDWTPIGSGSQAFFGYFDGQGHTITFVNEVNTEGIFTDLEFASASYPVGLFGYVAGGSVSNLGVNWRDGLAVENNIADADVYIGGIAGFVILGNVSNCYNMGFINISSRNGGNVGGIVGLVSFGEINNCYNTSLISCIDSAESRGLIMGGILGTIEEGKISNCYNTGTISGTASGEITYYLFVGGIAGQGLGSITNCYNTGSITANSENVQGLAAGGIAGIAAGTIVNCFSVDGQITLIGTAQQMGAGGILGVDMGGLAITNCYYDNELIGTASTLDGTRVVGLADLMKVESNFTNGSFIDSASTSHPWSTEPIQTTDPITQEPMQIQPQWDFENVWGIDSSINNGYPYLLYMSQGGTGEGGSENHVTITNDTEKAVLVVISSDGSTVMFKVHGGATKTYTMPIALDTTYKVSVIGGTITSVPSISGGEITDQQSNTFNVTFTESGSLGINV